MGAARDVCVRTSPISVDPVDKVAYTPAVLTSAQPHGDRDPSCSIQAAPMRNREPAEGGCFSGVEDAASSHRGIDV